MSIDNELLVALIKVRDADGDTNHGICCAILPYVKNIDAAWDRLDELFKQWPKYSGIIHHPIPGGGIVYDKAKHSATLWDRNTEYGKLRWELLEWLIEELQK